MLTLDAAYVRAALPRRDTQGHKGDFGKVYVLGGSVGYTGAPVFCSRAAVRTGCGLVFLGVPAGIWQVAAVKSDEAMPHPLPSLDGRLSLAAEADIRRRAHGLRHGTRYGERRAGAPPADAGAAAGAGRRWHKRAGAAYR